MFEISYTDKKLHYQYSQPKWHNNYDSGTYLEKLLRNACLSRKSL